MQKTSNFTKMNDLKRETNEALRNQKDYQNKINTIKNRINAIKKQEKDWTKKMDQIKRLEQGRENYRNGKIDWIQPNFESPINDEDELNM